MDTNKLFPEELEFLSKEAKDNKRCINCEHLIVFHHYNGGGDICYIPFCSCER